MGGLVLIVSHLQFYEKGRRFFWSHPRDNRIQSYLTTNTNGYGVLNQDNYFTSENPGQETRANQGFFFVFCLLVDSRLSNISAFQLLSPLLMTGLQNITFFLFICSAVLRTLVKISTAVGKNTSVHFMIVKATRAIF